MVQNASFVNLRDKYFDVTAEDAVDKILANSKKSADAREKDAEFVRRLRQNEFVVFGGRDWSQQRRFDRAAERDETKRKRGE